MANGTPNPNVIMQIINRLRLVARLLSDRRVPGLLKIIPFAGLIYLLFPFDIVNDMIPVLGQIDDLGVLILGIETFIRMSPPNVVAEHEQELLSGQGAPRGGNADNVVDADWKEVK